MAAAERREIIQKLGESEKPLTLRQLERLIGRRHGSSNVVEQELSLLVEIGLVQTPPDWRTFQLSEAGRQQFDAFMAIG
jgi:predicted transcriptional regulator